MIYEKTSSSSKLGCNFKFSENEITLGYYSIIRLLGTVLEVVPQCQYCWQLQPPISKNSLPFENISLVLHMRIKMKYVVKFVIGDLLVTKSEIKLKKTEKKIIWLPFANLSLMSFFYVASLVHTGNGSHN